MAGSSLQGMVAKSSQAWFLSMSCEESRLRS